MHWLQILFDTEKNTAERLEQELSRLDALAVTLLDAADQPLFEPLPGETPLWDAVRLMALFDASTDTEQVLRQAEQALGHPLPPHKVEILEDKDWIKEWMDQFQPIRFSDKLWICPTWCQPPDPGAANIMLDPGLAFGTGTHATTALCLTWLSELELSGSRVIDYGCGSGVLAVGAILLGSTHALCVDIDPQALKATTNNMQQNQLDAHRYQICLPKQVKSEPVEVLVANILAGPLIQLAETLSRLVLPQGKIGLSGILKEQAAQVIAAYQPYFELSEPVERDGWVLLTGHKKS